MSQSQDTREAMLNLWADGASLTQVAMKHHVTRSTVSGLVNRARQRGDVRATYRLTPPKRIAPVKRPPNDPRAETFRVINVRRFEEGEDLLPPKPDYIPRFIPPKAKPKPTPAVPPVDPTWATQSMREGGGIGLLDLPFTGMCKWPLGEPRDPGFLYCGASTDEKHVYCVCHRRIAYGAGTPGERKATSIALRFA